MSRRLESWKEIAAHLRSSVRTVQRWEKTEGLPVRRHQHATGSTVYALGEELDAWREARAPGEEGPRPTAPATAPIGSWEGEVEALLGRISGSAGSTAVGPRRAVGRDSERKALERALDDPASHRLVCLAGEPGIGKTALLDDFGVELRLRRAGCAVARGACSERLAGGEAYLPMLDALGHLLAGAEGEPLGELLRLVAPTWFVQVAPLWLREDPRFAGIRDAALGASSERLKRELAAFLRTLARACPVVVMIDDLHWADAPTVELLAYLARSSDLGPVLLVVAYRGSELRVADHPFLSVKRELQERRLCRELAVGFLTAADVAEYLARVYPENDFPTDLASGIHARTEGSPLFLVGLLGELERLGRIQKRDRGWSLEGGVAALDTDLPESVRGMIERQIARLDPDDHALLNAASVQGASFDSLVVARALAQPADQVEQRLRRLQHVHGLVRRLEEREFPDGSLSETYGFVHILYQNHLHAELTPNQRVRLSLDVAEAWEAHAEPSHSVAHELALLFFAGRDFLRASRHFVRAASHARELAATAAAALARRAVECAQRLDTPEARRQLLEAAMLQGDVEGVLARFADAIAAYELAVRTARELGDGESEVHALCGIASRRFFARQLDDCQRVALEALDVARRIESPVCVATAECVLALHQICLGNLDAAQELYDEALPVLTSELDQARTLEPLSFSGLIHVWRLEWDATDRSARRWMRSERARELPPAQIHFFMGMAEGNRGRLGRALHTLREGRRLAELNEDVYYVCRLPNTEGWLLRELGDIEGAMRLDRESVSLGRELGFEEAEANAHINLAEDWLGLGEPARALEHLEIAQRLFEKDVWFRWRYNMRLQAGYARYFMEIGDLKHAKDHVQASLDIAIPVKARKHIAGAWKLRGDIAALEERLADSRSAYASALDLLGKFSCPTLEWRVLDAAARLEDRAGADDAARALRARGAGVIGNLARSLGEDPLRESFLRVPEVRSLLP